MKNLISLPNTISITSSEYSDIFFRKKLNLNENWRTNLFQGNWFALATKCNSSEKYSAYILTSARCLVHLLFNWFDNNWQLFHTSRNKNCKSDLILQSNYVNLQSWYCWTWHKMQNYLIIQNREITNLVISKL